jgi:hypothetical protein
MMTDFRVIALTLSILLPQALAIVSSSKRLVVTPTLDADSAPKNGEVDALLQAGANDQHVSKAHSQPPAAWFGSFSQGESTYNYDGTLAGRSVNPEIDVMDGWDPKPSDTEDSQVRPAKWFQESASGGHKDAWQTYYPPENVGMPGNNIKTGQWFTMAGGTLQQDFISESARAHQKLNLPAAWFDSYVSQLDGFGRDKLPGLKSPRNYVDWEERSVNTTLACDKPGCTAKASLLAPFDMAKQVYKNCKLSVAFHPTDFDDQYSGEMVEWIQVNNKQVSANCRPFAAGCNETAQRPLINCVSDLAIDEVLQNSSDGALSIAAKIPHVVDECPYNGNLLSAVPMVTCLVSQKEEKVVPKPVISNILLKDEAEACVTSMPLQCATRGCGAEIAMPIDEKCMGAGQCTLSINVSHTDFDNSEAADSELIEYIKVDGQNVKTSIKPGQNPCKTAWSGATANRTAYSFAALENHVVNITDGRILIEGKISDFVDECASNGFLLDAIAHVTCKGSALLQTRNLLHSTGRESRRLQVRSPAM